MEKILYALVSLEFGENEAKEIKMHDVGIKEFIESFIINMKNSNPFDKVYSYKDVFEVTEERKDDNFFLSWSLYLDTSGIADAIVNGNKDEITYQMKAGDSERAIYGFGLYGSIRADGLEIVEGIFIHAKGKNNNCSIIKLLLEKYYSSASIKILAAIDEVKISELTESLTGTLEFELTPSPENDVLNAFRGEMDSMKISYGFKRSFTSVIQQITKDNSLKDKYLNCEFKGKVGGEKVRGEFDFENNVLYFANKDEVAISEEKIPFEEFQRACKVYQGWISTKDSKVESLF